MGDKQIDERSKESSTRMGEYCGASAVATTGDVAAEYRALRGAAGLISLTWRKRLILTGSDRVRWLNGMVTNNIRDLPAGRGVYSFFLNAQGRILADMYCFNRGDDLLVETDAAQLDGLRAAFDKYIIMDDVEVAEAPTVTNLAVIGPRAPDVLREVFGDAGESLLAAAPLELRTIDWRDASVTVVRGDDAATARFEISLPTGNAADLWRALTTAGATPVGTDALEMLRIWSGRPRYGVDITERQLPQETGQQRALHFRKGCYLGQEIVERIHSRAILHREFSGFAFDATLPPPGSPVEVDGKQIGYITSVAKLPGDDGPPLVGLGYVRRDAAAIDTVVKAGGVPARVVRPPFVYVAAGK